MAASNYSVNIKLDTKPARVQLEALERRVNKLRANLNAPLRIESKATLIKKQQLALEDKKFSLMSTTRRLGDRIRKFEEQGLKLDRLKLELKNAAIHTDKEHFQTVKDTQKFVAKELDLEQKKLAVIEKSNEALLKGRSTGFKAASGSMVRGEYGPQMLPTKGAGQAAQDIDFRLKQQKKRLGFEIKLRELEFKGVNTTKLRIKMGKLVDAQNKTDLGSIKQINAEIGNGITKEIAKLRILEKQNKQRKQSKSQITKDRTTALSLEKKIEDIRRRSFDKSLGLRNNQKLLNHLSEAGLKLQTKKFDLVKQELGQAELLIAAAKKQAAVQKEFDKIDKDKEKFLK